MLAAHRILSAPVVVGNGGGGDSAAPAAETAGGDKAPEVCGFIDIRDLLSSFLHGALSMRRCVKLEWRVGMAAGTRGAA